MPYIRIKPLVPAIGLLSVIMASGCHKDAAVPSTPTGSVSSLTDTVATVNGEKITTAAMYDSMSHYTPAQLPGGMQNPMVNEPASHVALQFLIENAVVSQLAKEKGAPVTQDQIDSRYNDLKSLEETQIAKPFDVELADEGFTPESYKSEVLGPQMAQFNLLTSGVTTTDAQMQAFYNSNIANFKNQNRVHIERSTFGDKATADAAFTSAVTTGSLSQFASKGKQGDTDFAKWIEIDKPQPGMPADLVTQLRTAKAGDVLKPMMLFGDWTVIRVVEKKPAATQKFADVKHMINMNLLEQAAQQQGKAQQLQQDIAAAIQSDTIETSHPEFKQVIEEIKTQSKRPATPPPGAPMQPGGPQPPH